MMLLAAPKIDKLPAMVLPAAKANRLASETEWCMSSGKYKMTRGTLDIN